MCSMRKISIALVASSAALASAFVTPPARVVHQRQQQESISAHPPVARTAVTTSTSESQRLGSSTALNLSVDPTQLPDALSSASLHLATVSADIDSIPTDEFGLVFAGGIAVMLGGVVSALIVGLLLDSGDSYSSVIAESYEGRVTKEEIMADEEFWSKLTPEQQEEAKKLLGKVKESKERGGTGLPLVGEREEAPADADAAATSAETEQEAFVVPTPMAEKKPKQAVSMFDDYE
mmetsp:Transcript_6964/g.16617  ORF Transcript_6964/g.16617 Transcript_6964/m.16617 type:complete len:235 (+) Transcript_6964:50-754(+)